MIVVTDTSVVLNLCALRQEVLLPVLFGSILSPPSLMSECDRLTKIDSRFTGLLFPAFIQIRSATKIRPDVLQNERLHEGEREALALAAEIGAEAILMDERAGRGVARALGLPSIGVLGILVQAKTLGLVPEIRPLLCQLQSHARFWIAPALMQQVLSSVGE